MRAYNFLIDFSFQKSMIGLILFKEPLDKLYFNNPSIQENMFFLVFHLKLSKLLAFVVKRPGNSCLFCHYPQFSYFSLIWDGFFLSKLLAFVVKRPGNSWLFCHYPQLSYFLLIWDGFFLV